MDDDGRFLIRACGIRTRSSATTGVGLGGLVSRPEIAVLGGLPFASSDFRDFHTHGRRTWIDDLSAPSGRFVARVTAAVTTDDCRPGRGEFFLPPTLLSLRFLPYPPGAARARQKSPLPRRVSPSTLLPRRALHREPTPPRSRIRPRPPLRHRATRHLRLPCRLRPHFHSDAPKNSHRRWRRATCC